MRETCGRTARLGNHAALSASGNYARHQPPSLSPPVHNEKPKVQPLIERRRNFDTMCNTLSFRKEAKNYMAEHLMPNSRTRSDHSGQPFQVCILWSNGSVEASLYNPSEESKDK